MRKFLKEAMTQISDRISDQIVQQEEFQPLVETIFEESHFTLEE